eukprot:g2303.t1
MLRTDFKRCFPHHSFLLKATPKPTPVKEKFDLLKQFRKLNFTQFLKSPYDGRIFALAGPALLTLAADPLLSIVDTIYVGKLGSNELAALGVNTGVFSLAFIVFNFLAVTTTTLVAAAVASDDTSKAGQATTQSFTLALVLGLALLFSLESFVDPILHTMGATEDLMDISRDYLVSRSIAAPAALLCLSAQGVFRGLQDTRTPLVITLIANSINFVLDPVLIYGLHMGVKGAALSTAFAEISSAVAYCGLLWRRRSELGLDCSFSDAMTGARASYVPFLSSGGTVLLRTSVLIGTKTLASSVATHLGPVAIASHQVVAQLWLLHSLLSDAIAIAGQSLVATLLARQNRLPLARKVSNRVLQLGAYLGGLMTLIYAAGYPLLPQVFTSDAAVVDSIHQILPLAILMLPVNSVAYVFDGVMIGASDFKFMAWSMAASCFIASASLLMVVPYHWGLEGVWSCQSGLMVLRFVILTHRYNQKTSPIPPLTTLTQLSDKES